MSRHRPQRDLRIIAVLLSAFTILAAACGSTEDTESSVTTTTQPTTTALAAPVSWQPLPADGKCRSGMVLRQGESCIHEYSYQIGESIGASGVTPIVEEVSIDFLVDADGEGSYYGRNGGPTDDISISRSTPYGSDIKFIAYAQSDGTFYIEEATSNDSFASPAQPDTASAADCSVGMVLSAGESCALAGGGEFSIEPDGKGCLGRSFCSGGGLTINEFSATNDDGIWTIRSIAG